MNNQVILTEAFLKKAVDKLRFIINSDKIFSLILQTSQLRKLQKVFLSQEVIHEVTTIYNNFWKYCLK